METGAHCFLQRWLLVVGRQNAKVWSITIVTISMALFYLMSFVFLVLIMIRERGELIGGLCLVGIQVFICWIFNSHHLEWVCTHFSPQTCHSKMMNKKWIVVSMLFTWSIEEFSSYFMFACVLLLVLVSRLWKERIFGHGMSLSSLFFSFKGLKNERKKRIVGLSEFCEYGNWSSA